MAKSSEIKLIGRNELDAARWDNCIEQASNGLVYAYSFYLDNVSPGWTALVMNDYEAVMPLTGKKKYGFFYLAQPFLAAQLGIFGNKIDGDKVKMFLDAVPAKYRYCDIYLNHGNVFPVKDHDIYFRKNFVLDLSHSFETLQDNFRENIHRNIKRAKDAGCKTLQGIDVEEVITLARAQMRTSDAETRMNIDRFRALYAILREKKMADTSAVVSASGKVLASSVFFLSNGRAYYILVGNHPDGRTLGASHALISYFIEKHSGKDLLLDFEGSDIRNLAFFYSSFGAKEEVYAGLRWNRLPFWLKWLKK